MLASLCSVRGSSLAGPEESERIRRSAVVLRVGARSVTVAELEDRLAAVPRFQLTDFGKTPAEIRKGFLERIVVPELLLSAAAEAEGKARELPWSQELSRARSSASLRALKATVPSASQVPEAEVRAYFEANRGFYESPERIHVSRILLATQAEAETVLAAARKELTLQAFTELARAKSLDKATHMRAGNLGFLGPDGTSNQAGLKADPGLVVAARTVKDGELVPNPVPEGSNFAVVWRRGTVAATRRTYEDAAPQIRDSLARRKLEEATKRHIDELTKAHVSQRDDSPLTVFKVPVDDGPLLAKPGSSAKKL